MKTARFSRNLTVGFRDRGLGRGDYGVKQGERLIARLEDFGIEFPPGNVPEILPVYENACLFAASPDLFDACDAAIQHIKATTKDATMISLLEEACKKALPSTEDVEDESVS